MNAFHRGALKHTVRRKPTEYGKRHMPRHRGGKWIRRLLGAKNGT